MTWDFKGCIKFCCLVAILSSNCACSTANKNIVYDEKQFNHIETGTLYLYRPPAFYGVIGGPNIYLDGKKIRLLNSGDYMIVSVVPGRRRLAAKWHFLLKPMGTKNTDFEFDIQANESIYIRYGITNYQAMPTGSPMVPLTVSGNFRFSVGNQHSAKKVINLPVENDDREME
ncbi:MAG: DUF2846 domain-containing protein [Gammaproteobacteria bacterium]